MFGPIFALIGVWVSYLYPLTESFKLLAHIDQSKQPVVLPPQSQFQRWFVYWLVLAVCTMVISNRFVATILRVVPFGSLMVLYLRFWLVFPLVSVDPTGSKVTGSYVLYHFYFMKWLVLLNRYLGELKTADFVRFVADIYNKVIDQYFSNYQFLKVSAPLKEDKTTVEMMSDFWQASGWGKPPGDQGPFADYFPQLLVSSLVSPLKSMLYGEHKDVKEDYDLVNKDELSSENASSTSLPRLRQQSSSSSLRKTTPSGTESQYRASSWGFGWKSRSSSVNYVEEH
ncbi:hypothetical protein OGAPHI_001561 [Ogataea philodendri]|uniref:Protein YOP1 n=1 Tax=Ogataea philodendri TaxID=1378263 RepID=A0A9P8T8P4_9ASCO|nr:uncharacterized protein OGAPHI_001561 [Ogataea philodendri]KAH3669440.1 hypothetical protein OGAPHI_001561 [Ogataea philodendri]